MSSNFSRSNSFLKPLFLFISAFCVSSLLAQGQRNFQFEGPAILIHGGAGTIKREYLSEQKAAEYHEALDVVLSIGYDALANGDNGMDVVVACLTALENDPHFNAGKGAVFNDQRVVELDASVMNGSNLKAGAVAGLQHVKNPAQLARLVMDSTAHVLLMSEGAEEFAKTQNVELVDNTYFLTPRRKEQYERWEANKKNGTVGVVVLDAEGNVYAGTSTGGMMGKKYGRVGDVPIIGAGTYADNEGAAVSCTGHGEYYIRNSVAFQINARMKWGGKLLDEAAYITIFDVLNAQEGNGGMIGITADGRATWTFNSAGMYRGAKGVESHTGKLMSATAIFEE